MKISDLIIIYLACGAPFAAYYYLQNRRCLFFKHLVVKTVLNFIFWIPLSLKLILKFVSAGKRRKAVSVKEPVAFAESDAIRKPIERFAARNLSVAAFYEFKEILNRYHGLSLALLEETGEAVGENRIFEISNSKNAEIGAICLQRRNRQRLSFHQTCAAEDFARAAAAVSQKTADAEQMRSSAVKLANFLQDPKTVEIIDKYFARVLQIGPDFSVRSAENNLWNAQPLAPSKPERISMNLNSMKTLPSPRD